MISRTAASLPIDASSSQTFNIEETNSTAPGAALPLLGPPCTIILLVVRKIVTVMEPKEGVENEYLTLSTSSPAKKGVDVEQLMV